MTNLATPITTIDGLTATLRKLMSEINISEAELARRTNIPQPTLHKILSGKTEDPRASTLKSLASFFNVSIDALLSASIDSNTHAGDAKTKSIAIISWVDCLNNVSDNLNSTNWDHWITTEHTSAGAFALSSKPSMEPRFPKGSILIFDPNMTPEDGDLILVHFPNTPEATIRELILDGPSKQLATICNRSTADSFDPDIKVLGVLVKSVFRFH